MAIAKKDQRITCKERRKTYCCGMALIICKTKVSREDLEKIPSPKVSEDSTHRPIPYHRQASLVHKALIDQGFQVVEEDHGIAKPANFQKGKWVGRVLSKIKNIFAIGLFWRHYFGGFALTHPNVSGERHRIVVGLRNSCDKTLAASIVVGSKMMVCSNLDFGAEIKLSRKNTLNAEKDLPGIIDTAVSRIMGHWHNIEKRMEVYKGIMVSEKDAGYHLTHLVRVESLPKQYLFNAIELFRNPASGAEEMIDENDFENQELFIAALADKKEAFTEEFGKMEDGQGSLWALYNALTYVLKGTALNELPNRTMIAQSYFDKLAKFNPVVGADLEETDLTEEEQTEAMSESFSESSLDNEE
jgi:hypothetical protein